MRWCYRREHLSRIPSFPRPREVYKKPANQCHRFMYWDKRRNKNVEDIIRCSSNKNEKKGFIFIALQPSSLEGFLWEAINHSIISILSPEKHSFTYSNPRLPAPLQLLAPEPVAPATEDTSPNEALLVQPITEDTAIEVGWIILADATAERSSP